MYGGPPTVGPAVPDSPMQYVALRVEPTFFANPATISFVGPLSKLLMVSGIATRFINDPIKPQRFSRESREFKDFKMEIRNPDKCKMFGLTCSPLAVFHPNHPTKALIP